jgi:hypothetical protein
MHFGVATTSGVIGATTAGLGCGGHVNASPPGATPGACPKKYPPMPVKINHAKKMTVSSSVRIQPPPFFLDDDEGNLPSRFDFISFTWTLGG